MERAIRLAGYDVGRPAWVERDRIVWADVAASAVIVGGIAFLATVFGPSDIGAGAGDLATGGLVVALLLGLAAGVSTCMALVGGLVLGLSASFEAASGPATRGLASRLRPGLVFVLGRIVGYGAFGAILGALGASIAMPARVTAILMVLVAIVMAILGTRLTGVSPRIAGWSPTLPTGVSRALGLGGGTGGRYSDGRAATLGALSFFLPCGFTQAVQVFALSTGSPVFAGALLAIFAVGTAPGLLALAGLPAIVPSGARTSVLRFVGVVVLAFALADVTAALRLAGVSLPSFGGGSTVAAVGSVDADGTQTLRMSQEAGGYSPNTATIYAGIPTRWVIDSKTTASCASSIVVPSLNISRRLELGPNTIELPALAKGTVYYSCAMGMFGGSITVVDKPATTGRS